MGEHRTKDTLNKVQDIEKKMKEKERLAYLDPVKCEEERLKGNEHFKKGAYPEALKCYSEAIKRNPEKVQKRAMNDPEVRKILQDPAMKMILDQISNDPKALGEHMKNPTVKHNIQKLIDVGILQVP